MQLDSTRIAIRERDLADIMDLSLRVVRAYAWPLFWTTLAGVVPFAILNYFLTRRASVVDYDATAPWDYIWFMLFLVVLELPLAAAPTTLFLGQAMFERKPSPRRIARDLLGSLPQMVFFQVFLRGLLLPMVITGLLPFASWPYLNEIILLERNPMMAGRRATMTTFRRSNALHARSRGDLLGRFLTSAILAIAMTLSLWITIWHLAHPFTQKRLFEPISFVVYLPLAMWIVAGYFAVVRYLCYLDLRIRREGWEVELQLRAEAGRLARQIA